MARADIPMGTAPRPRAIRRPAGFTLVELLVALALSGLVLLGARGVLVSVASGAEAVSRASTNMNRHANAIGMLRGVLGNLEVGTETAGSFVGAADSIRFTSWCDVPGGWQERCDVRLTIGRVARTSALRLQVARDRPIVLRSDFSRGAFIYLADPSAGGTWLRRWGESTTAPIAIGVVLDGDTTLVRIGKRG